MVAGEHGWPSFRQNLKFCICGKRFNLSAIEVGGEQIGHDESFAFRLNKTGSHWLKEETLKLEWDMGEPFGRLSKKDTAKNRG